MKNKFRINISIETKLKILWSLRLEDEYYFMKYGMELFTSDGIDIGIYQIEKIVLDGTMITPDQLKSKSQKHIYTEIRHLIWYFVKMKYPDATWSSMSKYYGKDRMTAKHGCDRVANTMTVDKPLRIEVERLKLLIMK